MPLSVSRPYRTLHTVLDARSGTFWIETRGQPPSFSLPPTWTRNSGREKKHLALRIYGVQEACWYLEAGKTERTACIGGSNQARSSLLSPSSSSSLPSPPFGRGAWHDGAAMRAQKKKKHKKKKVGKLQHLWVVVTGQWQGGDAHRVGSVPTASFIFYVSFIFILLFFPPSTPYSRNSSPPSLATLRT
ncbi:hypothetical protein LX36DRAFT_243261 [Colletotrichum falcatum]|nr:hypothetical protein LX36DRAFT_243261 [Colletotrichum falcatum]